MGTIWGETALSEDGRGAAESWRFSSPRRDGHRRTHGPAEVVQHQKQSRPRCQPGGRCRHLVSTQCGSGCSGDNFSLSFLRFPQRKAVSTCIVRTWGAGGSPRFCFAEQPRGWYCSGPNRRVTEVMLPVLLIPRGRTASPLLKVPTTLLPFLSLASAAASPSQRILELLAAGTQQHYIPHVAYRDGKKRTETSLVHTHTHARTHTQPCAYFTHINVNLNKAGSPWLIPNSTFTPRSGESRESLLKI